MKTTVTDLESEISAIEKQAATSKAELQYKLDLLNAKRAEYHGLVTIATEAAQRLQNAREQREIVLEIRAEAEQKIVALTGGEMLSRSWFALVKGDALAITSWVHSGSGNRNPWLAHGEIVCSATASIEVINRVIPQLESEATSARKLADSFAKSNGIEN